VNVEVLANDQWGRATAQSTVLSSRLIEVPAAGPVLVSPMVSVMPDTATFKSGGDLASWIGLVPRQNSSGGKERPRGTTKQATGNRGSYRWGGAVAVICYGHEAGA
jgi:transposase